MSKKKVKIKKGKAATHTIEWKKGEITLKKPLPPTRSTSIARPAPLPKPTQQFRLGELVQLAKPHKNFSTQQVRVCGYEWGGDNWRQCRGRAIWFYYVRPDKFSESAEIIAEDELLPITT